MKKTLLTAILLSSVTPVMAADIIVPEPVIEPVYQALPMWTGLYIGGQIGWVHGRKPPHLNPNPGPGPGPDPEPEQCDFGDFAWAGASTTNTSAIAWADPCKAWGIGTTPGTGSGAIGVENLLAPQAMNFTTQDVEDDTSDLTYYSGGSNDSLIGGVHIGYNHQFDNNFVLGAVADINFLKWNRYQGYIFSDDDESHTLEARQSLKYLGTVRAKLGYAMDRVLVYGTAGLAYGGVKDEILLDDYTYASESKTRFGYALGAGVDYLVADNFSIGAEYIFADLGKKSEFGAFDNNVRFHSIFVKASYHFK